MKLTNVELESLRDKLVKPLKDLSFEIIQRPVGTIGIRLQKEDIAAKDGVKVEIAYSASALNVIGDNPNKVSGFFDKIHKEYVNLGNDPEATVQFYEVISNIIISTNKEPNSIINEVFKLPLKSLKNYPNKMITAIPLSAINPETNEGLNIIIEASPSSPKNRFRLRLLYRATTPTSISQFSSKVESIISKILLELGA